MIEISWAKYSVSSSARFQWPSSTATSIHVWVLMPRVSRPSWRSGRSSTSLWQMGLAGQPAGRMLGVVIWQSSWRVGLLRASRAGSRA